MPGNPDPVSIPIELVQSFRAVSFIGQSAMWLIFISGKLCQKSIRAAVTQRTQPSKERITSIK